MRSSKSPPRYAVVLAGGGGTRLWPSSRRVRPKQLLRLGGRESLLRATIRRLDPVFDSSQILIVTARDQEEAIRREVPDIPWKNVLLEPDARNTAGSVGIAAACAAARSGWHSILAVLPADHYIVNETVFRRAVRRAMEHATRSIATVGIRPTAPETGYGYIKMGRKLGSTVHEVVAFVEKPDHRTAVRYLRSRQYLWNAGMFFLTAGRMRLEAERCLPRLHRLMGRLASVQTPEEFQALLDKHYRKIEAVSIDYGIMETAVGLVVLPSDFGWSDVGSWSALAQLAKRFRNHDKRGNVLVGDVLVLDGSKNIVISDPGAPFVGVVGIRGLVVVATADGVLVIPRERAQDVRRIVDVLREAKRNELLDREPGHRGLGAG